MKDVFHFPEFLSGKVFNRKLLHLRACAQPWAMQNKRFMRNPFSIPVLFVGKLLFLPLLISCSSLQKVTPEQQATLPGGAPEKDLKEIIREKSVSSQKPKASLEIPPQNTALEEQLTNAKEEFYVDWNASCPMPWQKVSSLNGQISGFFKDKSVLFCETKNPCPENMPVLHFNCSNENAITGQFVQRQPESKTEIFSLDIETETKGTKPDTTLLWPGKNFSAMQIPLADSVKLTEESIARIAENLSKLKEAEIILQSYAGDTRVQIEGIRPIKNEVARYRIPSGIHKVAISRPGHKTLKGVLKALPGEKIEIKARYPDDPVANPVKVVSLPPSLLVYKNNRFSGFTPRVYDKTEFTDNSQIQLVHRKNPGDKPEYYEIANSAFTGKADKAIVWEKGRQQGIDLVRKGILQNAECALQFTSEPIKEEEANAELLNITGKGECLLATPDLISARQAITFEILPDRTNEVFLYLSTHTDTPFLEIRGDFVRFISHTGYNPEASAWLAMNLQTKGKENEEVAMKPAKVEIRYHRAEKDEKSGEIKEKAFYQFTVNGTEIGKAELEHDAEPKIGIYLKHSNAESSTRIRNVEYTHKKKKFLGIL